MFRQVLIDSGGDAYAVGSFSYQATLGTTSLSTKDEDKALVAKLSPAGKILWTLVESTGTRPVVPTT